MNVDDLIWKIGYLTIENDLLRAEIKKLTEEIEELKRREQSKEVREEQD